MADSRSTIQSIERAVAVMRSFTESEPELGVVELSVRLGLHKSTVSRILSTLQREGLVSQNPKNAKYRLGVGLLSLAGVALGQVDVRAAAYDHLDALVEATHETVTVNVLDGRDCVTVYSQASPKPLRYASWVGRRLPLHATASGKILLAGLPERERMRLLDCPLRAYTAHTIVDQPALLAELETVRVRGYALAVEEYEQEFSGAAVPVFNYVGEVVAAISLSGPTFRLPETALVEYIVPLSRTAATVSAEMGFAERSHVHFDEEQHSNGGTAIRPG